MQSIDVSNPFYREKPDEKEYGKCKQCVLYKAAEKLCTKYNMISEPWKSCKSQKEKGD